MNVGEQSLEPMVCSECKPCLGYVKPEGGKSSALYQNPGSMHFRIFSSSDEKHIFSKSHVSTYELELSLGYVKPEGGKSSALYQNPGLTHFSYFLNIL